ncbi:YnbE family lipoprotein [Novosphingobium sp. B1]|uniref:YnbE family lipoprotein n=1 Tax=Novosphingobium sp. B1 TaxID=1938756 RepID=UPI0009D8A32B|nr:YnbE family lipoprotein [Novosphingobium sp. B1]SMC65828.1 YnbE-like lipoprotein [Novosphingobium sp. B1]
MRNPELTRSANPATKRAMGKDGFQFWLRHLRVLPLMGGLALAGCISVKAPDKPIVIELNINIKQEVVYRLAQDANNTIESNPDIF